MIERRSFMNIFAKIKNEHHFTEGEKTFAQYILNHPRDIVQCDVQDIAKKSYVSVSTIYRVVEKLGLSGFNQLKVQVSLQLDNYSHKDKEVDYNYPFQKHDTHHQIMEKMSSLYDQTIRSTIELIDLKVFLKVIQALYNANHIIIFSSIGNYFMAECFQQNMLELGLRIDVEKERYYQHWYAHSCQKGDVVMLISYAGRTPHMNEIVQILKEKGVTMILISSTIEIPFAKDVDYHLYFSPYEDSEEKIASFSSRISLQYLLDCIYASYFNRDYEKNLKERIERYID